MSLFSLAASSAASLMRLLRSAPLKPSLRKGGGAATERQRNREQQQILIVGWGGEGGSTGHVVNTCVAFAVKALAGNVVDTLRVERKLQ